MGVAVASSSTPLSFPPALKDEFKPCLLCAVLLHSLKGCGFVSCASRDIRRFTLLLTINGSLYSSAATILSLFL